MAYCATIIPFLGTIRVMKHRVFEYMLAWLLLTILAGIVVHAPLSVYIGSQWPAVADVIKTWKEWLLLVALVVTLVEVTRRRAWQLFNRDIFCWLVFGYALLHVGTLAWTSASTQAVLAGLAIDLRYVLYATLVYMFVRLYPGYYHSFIKIGIFGAALVVGFAALQLLLPYDALKYLGYSNDTIAPYITVDQNYDYIRINSTMRGPNPLGAYAAGVLVGVVAYVAYVRKVNDTRKYWLGAFGMASVLALWHSYSRSAFVAALVAVAFVVAVKYARTLPKKAWYTLALGTLLLVVLGVAVRDTSFVHNVILHDDPTTNAAVNSNEDHVSSLQYGFARMLTEPMGVGVGTTGSASLYGDSPLIVENQYLMVAHEVGWAGLALFLAIFGVVMHRLWLLRSNWMSLALFAGGIGMALIGILLPVWADDTVSIVWWGLAGAVMAKGSLIYKNGA